MRTLFVAFVLLGSVATARADREQRAASIYDTRCASCHQLGRGVPEPPHQRLVDLTMVWRRLGEKGLREWIDAQTHPHCQISGVVASDVDVLVGLFHRRSQPTQTPQVPPESARKPMAEPIATVKTVSGGRR
jgi:hypothetical protein